MNASQGSILVVDDEPVYRAMLRQLLESKGLTVTTVADGQQGLAELERSPYDVVLLDVVLPDRSGLEVLQTLRQTRSMTSLPVIMATARDQSDDTVNALCLGANDYVTKPFDFPVVLARVQTQLTLKRSIDRSLALEQSLAERNAALEAANRRMTQELEAAARVQEALLPAEPPQVPGLSFAWRYQPCAELAGDLLNVSVLEDRFLSLYVLDVSGHGVAAALLAVMINRVIHRLTGGGSGTAEVIPPAVMAAHLNDEFPCDFRTGQFFTLLYGVLDCETRTFRYVAAGHPGPVCLARNGEARVLDIPGLPIGLGDGHYPEHSLTLEPGDRLYLYSDGLPEARNLAKQDFGMERVIRRLQQGRSQPLHENLAALLQDVDAWCQPAPPQDDISLLAVEVEG